jgi:hypothetical protein
MPQPKEIKNHTQSRRRTILTLACQYERAFLSDIEGLFIFSM